MNNLRNSNTSPVGSGDDVTSRCQGRKMLERDTVSSAAGRITFLHNIIAVVQRLLTEQLTDRNSICSVCRQTKDKQMKEIENGLQEIDRELHQLCQSHANTRISSEHADTFYLQQQLQQTLRENERLTRLIEETQDEKEHIGAQLIAYKEDFETERQDRERAHGQIADLKIQLQQLQQRHEAERRSLTQQLQQLQQQLQQSTAKLREQEEEKQDQIYVKGHLNVYPSRNTASTAKITGCSRRAGAFREYSPMRSHFDDIEIDGSTIRAPPTFSRTAPLAKEDSASAGRYVRTSKPVTTNYSKTVGSSAVNNASSAAMYHQTRRAPAVDTVQYSTARRNEEDDTLVPRSGLFQTDSCSSVRESVSPSNMPLYEADSASGWGVDEADGSWEAEPTSFHDLTNTSSLKSLTAREVLGSECTDLDTKFSLLRTDGAAREFSLDSNACGIAFDSVYHCMDENSALDLMDNECKALSSDEYSLQECGPHEPNARYQANDLSLELQDSTDYIAARPVEEGKTTSGELLQCPRCRKAFSIEQHHLLLDHMEYVCMQ